MGYWQCCNEDLKSAPNCKLSKWFVDAKQETLWEDIMKESFTADINLVNKWLQVQLSWADNAEPVWCGVCQSRRGSADVWRKIIRGKWTVLCARVLNRHSVGILVRNIPISRSFANHTSGKESSLVYYSANYLSQTIRSYIISNGLNTIHI